MVKIMKTLIACCQDCGCFDKERTTESEFTDTKLLYFCRLTNNRYILDDKWRDGFPDWCPLPDSH